MDESTIQRLLKEAESIANINDVYDLVSKRIDTVALTLRCDEGKLTFKDIGANFAYIGFLEGVEFALRNIEQKDESAIPVIIHTEEKPDPEQVTVQIVTEETQTPREVNVQIITKEGEST